MIFRLNVKNTKKIPFVLIFTFILLKKKQSNLSHYSYKLFFLSNNNRKYVNNRYDT